MTMKLDDPTSWRRPVASGVPVWRIVGGLLVAAVIAVVVITSSHHSSGSTGGSGVSGCALYGEAGGTYIHFRDGLRDETSLPVDAAGQLQSIHGKLSDLAVAGDARLQGPAGIAATDAGQLRVALLAGDSGNVTALASDLDQQMSAMDGICSAR